MTAWNNPAGRAAARTLSTGSEQSLDNHGDAVWDICFLGCIGEPFTTDDIVAHVMRDAALARRTAHTYVRAFLAYAAAAPDQFSGPASRITPVKRGTYVLQDNPEQ
jgi:hypothetical protein